MYVFLIEFDLRDTLQSPFSCFQFSESSGSAILTICQVSCSLITTMVLKSEGSKNKSVISRMLGFKPKNSAKTVNKYSSAETEVLNLNISDATMPTTNKLRVFVATWNVGGNPPSNDLNLDDFLQVQHDLADIYILGFQEIVPLNAGNILVLEDNEPAAKWLSLINRSLNKPSPPLTAGHNDDDDDDNQYYHSLRTATSLDSSYTNKISSSKVAISSTSTLLFHQKYSLKAASKQFRTESKKMLKKCNCRVEQAAVAAAGRRCNYNSRLKDSCFRKRCERQRYVSDDDMSSEEEDHGPSTTTTCTTTRSLDLSDMAAVGAAGSSSSPNSSKCIDDDDDDDERKYGLIVSKQMVGIFLTIWVKRELVQHISHLRSSYIPRGMMGCLGNKGCISVSLSIYQTTFCVICSHLASGEKEGDELRRNMDVIEILKNTQFRRRCKVGNSSQIPDKILEHDRVIWLGDLNYRITLSYAETRKLLERNDWDSLLSKDQLKMEREAGRVFKGWREGKICFAPTYKFSFNSNTYFAETNTSKNKRRTPAWCDRILWHGNGVKQLTYKCKDCKEFRFSDHRPVYANFIVDVNSSLSTKKRYFPPESNMKIEIEELLPPSSTST